MSHNVLKRCIYVIAHCPITVKTSCLFCEVVYYQAPNFPLKPVDFANLAVDGFTTLATSC